MVTTGPGNGFLFIHGGGTIDDEFKRQFRLYAGGATAPFVCIPTATDPIPGYDEKGISQAFGFSDATIRHTRDQMLADSETFVRPIKQASAVYIDGGRQWRLADAYLNTRTHRELEELLDRGGVIAGSSAGATIMGSFLIRGDTTGNKIIIGDHTEGFGLIKHIAIDQHIKPNKIEPNHRWDDLAEVIAHDPDLLGIGIAQDAGILVEQDVISVLPGGFVLVHDGPPPLEKLNQGQRYDMRARQVL